MTDANGVPRSLPLSAIDVEEGFNPRTTTDEKRQAQLVESVRRHGILQPLLVAPAGEGEGFRVVAGHRRLAAAAAVGLMEVPTIVREPENGEAPALAVIENLQREDLNPIDEARGLEQAMRGRRLNQTQLAEELSISPKRVSERLGLLRLPEEVQARIAAGGVPPALRKTLAAIAKVSPEVAEGCSALVAAGHVEASAFEADPARVVAMLERVSWQDDGGEPKAAPVALAIEEWRPVRLDGLPLDEAIREELRPRLEALGTDGWGDNVGVRFDTEDADAGRAYGCLLEFRDGDRYRTAKFLCDRDFIADRARLKVDDLEERARVADERTVEDRRRRAEQGRTDAVAAGVEVDEDADPEAALREQRRREREAEREETVAARGANLELGRRLYTDAHAPELTMDHARLLALLVFESDAGRLAAGGLALCRDDWQEVEVRELKSGEERTKVTYPSPTEAEGRLWSWLERARTPQEVLGRVVQALVAAGCADESCRPQSQRIHYSLPGTYGGGAAAAIGELVDLLAKPYLPPRLAEQARSRAEWRAQYAADLTDVAEIDQADPDGAEPEGEAAVAEGEAETA